MKPSKFFLLAMLLAAFSITFIACSKDDDDDDDTEMLEGVQGRWYSSGANVAVLLASEPFNIDSIYAEFKTDLTYHVESFDTDGVRTTFTGVYEQRPSGTGNIWTIKLTQNVPTAVTSEGIFEVHTNEVPHRMRYEVLQTEPALGFAPPTPEAGFGSTAGGAFLTTNIQTFLRITN